MGRTLLRWIILPWLLIAAGGCATSEMQKDRSPDETAESPPTVPVISRSFASPRIFPGKDWKVYLQASHPGGDMRDFFCTVQQPGVGTYPVGITRIREENKKSLSGYLFLPITAYGSLEFVELTLTVQVRDRAGQFSEPVHFPLSINSRYSQEPPPEETFQENNLGPILIQLRTVGDDDRPGRFDRFPR